MDHVKLAAVITKGLLITGIESGAHKLAELSRPHPEVVKTATARWQTARVLGNEAVNALAPEAILEQPMASVTNIAGRINTPEVEQTFSAEREAA
jgi:hypothetical protein